MRIFKVFFLSLGLLLQCGCSPVKDLASNEYQLSAYSLKQLSTKPRHVTLSITAPEAAAGYQTEEMLYVNKPFKLEAFAKNVWTDPPADMLYPLLIKSLQRSGYFYAVLSSPYNNEADYRLDTQLLTLEQNFLKKPSVLVFTAKVSISRVSDNKVIASQIINEQIPCPADTPYGGVIAANQASERFTAIVAQFAKSHIK